MNVYKIIIIVISSVFLGLNVLAYFTLFLPLIRKTKQSVPKQKNDLPPLNKPFSDSIFNAIKFLEEHEKERITQISLDKHKLAADLYTVENAKGTVILCHGFKGYAYTDCGVAAEHFVKSGYNALVIYQRSHYESEGKNICFGIKERYDCLGWIKMMNERFGETLPLYLYGVSMGAATVLMTTGFDLPKNIKCVIADCGFTSPYEIIKSCAKAYFMLKISQFIIYVFAGYNIKQYSTLKAMEKNEIPIIFFHGLKDSFVPPYMTEQNYNACKAKKEMYLIPEAKHTQSLYLNPEFYWSKIDAFMQKSTDGTFEKEMKEANEQEKQNFQENTVVN